MSRRLAVVTVIALAAVILAGVAYTLARPATPPTPVVLLDEWEGGTDLFLLTVPPDCPTQTITYQAWQKIPGYPSIEFVVSKQNEPVTSTGKLEYEEYVEGATTWTLAPTAYALTARGVNSRWRFAVACGPGASPAATDTIPTP